MKRILIADDHLMFVAAMQFLLRSLDETIQADIAESIEEVRRQLDGKTYDLVLLDLIMPGMNGLEALKALRDDYPDLPIAILSGVSGGVIVQDALSAGAVGWIPKTMGGEPLIHALRLMAKGQRFCPPELLRDAQTDELFSAAERRVGELLGRGMTDKEIANQLGIAPGTVKVHVKKLLRKSGADNRTQFALRQRNLEYGSR
jgi:DNA-binding NarL/FixJ family response regulator